MNEGQCDGCKRSAGAPQRLYMRTNGRAVYLGRYGPKCFYVAARVCAANGWPPERENTKPVRLRGAK